jgi:starch synthase
MIDDFTQFVIIGTGEQRYEDMLRYYAGKYPGKVSANICYADDLSHKLYAAADSYLMPSVFEPCGLSQLIALKYGTVPIVRETGGLKDTIQPFNEYENTGNGFSFSNYNGDDMLNVINYAKKIYFENKRAWNKIVERGMHQDFSWKNSAKRYEDVYNFLMGN